jgi:hypothetical protein
MLIAAIPVNAQIIEPIDSLQSITLQNYTGSLVIIIYNNPSQIIIPASSINAITFPGDTTLLVTENNSLGTVAIALDSIQQILFQSSITAVTNQSSRLPEQFAVSQNYPNPFNPSTIINYALPKSSLVTIKIYNMIGQEAKTLVNGELEAGNYTAQWNGDDNFGRTVASGVYIYRVVAGQYVKSLKMMFLK